MGQIRDNTLTIFVKITNQQVYDELINLKDQNERQHDKIFLSIQGYKSQINRIYWALGGCIGLISTIILKLIIFN